MWGELAHDAKIFVVRDIVDEPARDASAVVDVARQYEVTYDDALLHDAVLNDILGLLSIHFENCASSNVEVIIRS